jgi:hypothetical protein
MYKVYHAPKRTPLGAYQIVENRFLRELLDFFFDDDFECATPSLDAVELLCVLCAVTLVVLPAWICAVVYACRACAHAADIKWSNSVVAVVVAGDVVTRIKTHLTRVIRGIGANTVSIVGANTVSIVGANTVSVVGFCFFYFVTVDLFKIYKVELAVGSVFP